MTIRECIWEWSDPDEEDYFETACDKSFYTLEGTLEENGFLYCPYCGGKIKAGNHEK